MKRNGLKFFLASAMLFVTIGFIFTPHLPFSNNPFVEKSCEYAVHGMIGLFVLSLLFFAWAKYDLMLVGMGCVGALCLFLKGESNDHLILPDDNLSPKISIAHFNLSHVDESYEDFIKRIKSIDADILSLQELTPNWDHWLSNNLKGTYRNALRNVRIDPFGKALFAKKKILKKDTINSSGRPNIAVNIEMGNNVVSLLSTYILPPLNNSSKKLAIRQLESISDNVQKSAYPTIVIGDLNMVYWSNEISEFRKQSGLENTRRGFTPLGFEKPYDHMFFTEELECSGFEEIEDESSNHLGIVGTFQFKNVPTEEEVRSSVGFIGSK